jgi:hypothetical protein
MTYLEGYQKKFEKLVPLGHEERVKTCIMNILELTETPDSLIEELHKYATWLDFEFKNNELTETFLENMEEVMKLTERTYGALPDVYKYTSKIARNSIPMAKYALNFAKREIIKNKVKGLHPIEGLLRHLRSMNDYAHYGGHKNAQLRGNNYLNSMAGPSHRGG